MEGNRDMKALKDEKEYITSSTKGVNYNLKGKEDMSKLNCEVISKEKLDIGITNHNILPSHPSILDQKSISITLHPNNKSSLHRILHESIQFKPNYFNDKNENIKLKTMPSVVKCRDNNITKANIDDAIELTFFSLEALRIKDVDLAIDRLRGALNFLSYSIINTCEEKK